MQISFKIKMDKNTKTKLNSLLFISIVVLISLIIFPNILKNQFKGNSSNTVEDNVVEEKSYTKNDIENKKNEDDGNKYLEKYYPNDKNDPFYQTVEAYIKELKYTPQDTLNSKNYVRDNYLAYAAMNDGTIHTFNKKSILIYVPQNRYYKVIHKAFVTYNYQFKGILLFQETKDPKKTDIKIVFKDKLTDSYDNEAIVGLGGAKKYDKNGNITYSELMVKNRENKSDDPELMYVYNILLHEIAHCIGVAGHSPNSGDLMFKSHTPKARTELQKFSPRDIETIRLMYSADKLTLDELLKYAKQTKLNENILYAKDSNSSDSYIKVADSYFNMGKYQESLDTYKKALELNPNNPRVYYNLGYSYHKMGKNNEAINTFKKAIDLGVTNEHIYNALGNCYYELNQYDEALNSYKQTLNYDSDNFAANSGIAECYLKLKNYDEALSYSQNSLRSAGTQDEKIFTNDLTGYIYSMKRDYISSMYYYKAELELSPKDKEAFINYISVCLNARKKDEAKQAYKTYYSYHNPSDFNENEKRMLKRLE